MGKIASCLLLILFSAICFSAQKVEKAVESIRERHVEITEKVRLCELDEDSGLYGELFMNELTVNKRNHQWRAVGTHQLTYRFFYKGGDSEKHLYPDQLLFIKTERRESNRTYRQEFLYSSSGILIFYFQRADSDDQVPAERRVYFAGAKAIRVIEDSFSRDYLSKKDLANVRFINQQSQQNKEFFGRSLAL